jgi:hypothetical protein
MLMNQGCEDPEMDCLLIKHLTMPVGRISEAVYLKKSPSHVVVQKKQKTI